MKNSRPCQDLNPGPPQYQADMLPIELTWLQFQFKSMYLGKSKLTKLAFEATHYLEKLFLRVF